jgi:hypothetical protein
MGLGLIIRLLGELAAGEGRSGADQGDQVGAFTARQRCCADSMSLNAMARPLPASWGPW